jgi:hypothetical protein
MFAHDLCHSQIEYLSNAIDFNRKDRAKPPARKGCSAYASESDTTNLQSSIFNIQFRLVRFGKYQYVEKDVKPNNFSAFYLSKYI